jgi:AI-2 transport protein TqsA
MDQPGVIADGRSARLRRELIPFYALAAAVVCAAGGWYLLKELAPLLRPLVLAVFPLYTILPFHRRLSQWVPSRLAGPLLALLTAAAVVGMAVLLYGNLVALRAELPRLIGRARVLVEGVRVWGRGHLPAWVFESAADADRAGADTVARLKAIASGLVNAAAGFLAEALVVALYLIFLLMEARHFPRRVRAGFAPEQADRMLGILESMNRAMVSYLRAKALASLVTALPVVAILWAFGVPFPDMWGVLVFIGNFIPYVGSLVAFTLPILLAFLELEPIWRPLAVLGLLARSSRGVLCDIELIERVRQESDQAGSDGREGQPGHNDCGGKSLAGQENGEGGHEQGSSGGHGVADHSQHGMEQGVTEEFERFRFGARRLPQGEPE